MEMRVSRLPPAKECSLRIRKVVLILIVYQMQCGKISEQFFLYTVSSRPERRQARALSKGASWTRLSRLIP